MYLEIEMSLSEEGDIKLSLDTEDGENDTCKISLTLITDDGETTISNIEKHRLAQFVVNCRRLITMAHEDGLLSSDDDEDEDDD